MCDDIATRDKEIPIPNQSVCKCQTLIVDKYGAPERQVERVRSGTSAKILGGADGRGQEPVGE